MLTDVYDLIEIGKQQKLFKAMQQGDLAKVAEILYEDNYPRYKVVSSNLLCYNNTIHNTGDNPCHSNQMKLEENT